MMKSKLLSGAALLCAFTACFTSGGYAGEADVSKNATNTVTQKQDTTPLDLFSFDSSYTGESNVRQALPLAKQSSAYEDFSYAHRIHLTGQWYLRLGVEYERYDFSSVPYPTPNHLQAASGIIACEYVVQGFAGAAIELHPGFYFENEARGQSFDVPFDVYTSFKIKDDKVFGMVGFYEGQFITPHVIPIGGVIWLINDKTRLEAIFPHPSLVYTLSDDWEFRLTGEISGDGFRVDKNGRGPQDYSNGVLLYDYMRAGAQVTYSHFKPFDLTVGAGYNFERQFDFFRSGPGQKYDASGAPYVKVAIEAKF